MSNHTKLYGICQNKCMVEITSKAEQETKDSAQDSKITTLEGDVSALETTMATKQDTITAGTGLSKSGVTINHSNSVTANTSGVGSSTKVPIIKYDGQGHITGVSTATIYPPTSVGTAGQYWESDGSGVGAWVTKDTAPTKDSTKAVTSGAVYTALSGKAASSHTHDDRYYTESEMNTKLSGKADTSALSAKQDTITGGATTITADDLTADRALISNNDGKVAVSAVTSTELGYLDGVTSAIQTQINGKQATMSAGTGISLSGATINHSNSVTANTNGVGSSTKVPIIKYDGQGHITSVTTATIYPPTSVGTAGQYWKSDGSGAGAWQTLDTAPTADSTNAVTSGGVKSALDAKVDTAGTGLSKSGTTLNHSNSVTAKTSYVGSATAVPLIKYDAQGHITGTSTATIYPPTSAGTAGQIWQSDGNGTGVWQTLDTAPTADSTKAVTSGGVKTALDAKAGTAVATTTANGLMSSEDKSKLDGIATGANKTTVDSALSSTSTNPVQNKVVNSALAGKQATLTAGTNISISGTTISATDTKYSAGTGVSLSGTTINHSNSVTAKTSYVGSATAVPMIKYDAQGHITATTTATIYAPTTAGSAGQIWVSDGSGAGTWKHKITMSTSDPSGGSDGDIWFKYE